MNTTEIMRMALDLCGFRDMPSDSAIFCSADNVHRILLGIDIEASDLHRAKAEGYDLVIAHHPLDETVFTTTMLRHEELLLAVGVPPNLAKTACMQNLAPYQKWMAGLPPNKTAQRLTSLAQELGLGLMNIHNSCDELGRIMFQKLIDELSETATVRDLMNRFLAIPEIEESGESVEMVCGSPDSSLGKAIMIHGAGTNGGYPVATALFECGINTVVYIHLNSPKQKLRLQEENKGNLILTGHYGSDSFGINPLIDALEARGIEVNCCNKMLRIKRKRIEQDDPAKPHPRGAGSAS
jgi:hypothetical protein